MAPSLAVALSRAAARRASTAAALCGILLLAATAAPRVLSAQAPDVPDSVVVRTRYVKREHRIAMRDGVRLHTVVYAPRDASPGRRYPIVLQRTPFSAGPYGDALHPRAFAPDGFMLRDGYVFVAQEVRGRYLSEGTFENVRPLLADSARVRDRRAVDEVTDAWDTIEWLVRNVEGNDGRVGLLGVSYGGYYAAAAALSRHPAIAAASLQAPVMDFYFEDFHHNGALVQGAFYAYPVFGAPRPAPSAANWWLPAFQRVAAAYGAADDYFQQLALGPLSTVTRRVHADDVWWRAMVAHPDYDAFWRARALPPRLRDVAHPVLVVGGWFDAENLYGTLAAHRALRERSPAAAVSLVMGPWGHRGWAARDVVHSVHGNLFFGDSLETAFQRDVEAEFFRVNLKGGEKNGENGGGTGGERSGWARMFDTGRKRWERFERWPAPKAVRRDFFLSADGSLGATETRGGAAFVEYVSDPRKPVPTRCAGPTIEDGAPYHYMSDDQRCVTSRPDVVTFQTDTLRDDLTIAGPLTARLWVSTTGTDADFVVKLVDVYPPDEPDHPWQRDTTVRLGGYQQLVRGEIMRGRYRRSFSTPTPFTPGAPTEVAFELPDVLHTFRKGHRLMVQVQSSWFPLFDRNPQRFVPSIYEARADDFVRATHRIWTSGPRASRIEATVLP